MPHSSRDPVDHARTTRQHAGETMKAGVNAPGLIAVGVGVVALFFGLAAFATGRPDVGIIGVVVAVLLGGAGLTWVVVTHRRVHERQKDWHREHPEVPYEPPTS
ncbi:MAG: protein UsfY [Actinomycetota bacterium]|nr:protein UsfY [Actinomycetota bacterium]